MDWKPYFKEHMERQPRELLMRAISHCKEKETALDLGAGTLIESKFLLESGFQKVIAVDSAEEVRDFAKEITDPRLEVRVTPFQELVLEPETFDLITAQFALPFYGREGFAPFIEKVVISLKKGGVFTGQFFGERDGWNNTEKNIVFQTKDEAHALLKDLRLVAFTEVERDGTVAGGKAKHWHVFNFIGIK